MTWNNIRNSTGDKTILPKEKVFKLSYKLQQKNKAQLNFYFLNTETNMEKMLMIMIQKLFLNMMTWSNIRNLIGVLQDLSLHMALLIEKDRMHMITMRTLLQNMMIWNNIKNLIGLTEENQNKLKLKLIFKLNYKNR